MLNPGFLSTGLLAVLLFPLTGCGGGEDPAPTYTAEQLAEGKKHFQVCAACHNFDGTGMPNLGKDMTKSEFIRSRTDDEMLAFIKVGRRSDDPLNTTGVDMPPKGGNPALDDDKIRSIIAHVRSLMK